MILQVYRPPWTSDLPLNIYNRTTTVSNSTRTYLSNKEKIRYILQLLLKAIKKKKPLVLQKTKPKTGSLNRFANKLRWWRWKITNIKQSQCGSYSIYSIYFNYIRRVVLLWRRCDMASECRVSHLFIHSLFIIKCFFLLIK